jgi:hypothetical protein
LKSLTFGLKRSDKKAKNFEMLAKALIKMLENNFFLKVNRKNNNENELKRLEKEEDNKFTWCFEGFLRHKCLF